MARITRLPFSSSGVSIVQTPMEHDINPNLIRTWISKYQREQTASEIVSSAEKPPRDARASCR
nr:transposase [Burkholderia sp. Nafp2/4-1b]